MQSAYWPGIVGTAHNLKFLGSGFQDRAFRGDRFISTAPTAPAAPSASAEVINSGKVRLSVRGAGCFSLRNNRRYA